MSLIVMTPTAPMGGFRDGGPARQASLWLGRRFAAVWLGRRFAAVWPQTPVNDRASAWQASLWWCRRFAAVWWCRRFAAVWLGLRFAAVWVPFCACIREFSLAMAQEAGSEK